MNWRRQPLRSTPIDTIVGQHTQVQGKLVGNGGIIRIEGRVEGDIETDGMAVLGEGGRVTGDVRAHDVVVGGCLTGDVTAPGHLELLPTGRLEGTVLVGAIIIADGAVFDGVCHIVGTDGLPLADGDERPATAGRRGDLDGAAPPSSRVRDPVAVAAEPAAAAEAPTRADPAADRPPVPRAAGAGADAAPADPESAAAGGQPAPAAVQAAAPPEIGRARWQGAQPDATAGAVPGSAADPARASGEARPAVDGAAPGHPDLAALRGTPAVATVPESEDGPPGFPLMPLLGEAPPGSRQAQGHPLPEEPAARPRAETERPG